MLEYSIFLFLGKVEVEVAVGPFLIDDLVAMGVLLVEDLNGQFTVIVQLLQKIAYFFLIQVGELVEDDVEVGFQCLFVGSEGRRVICDHDVLCYFGIAGQKWLDL